MAQIHALTPEGRLPSAAQAHALEITDEKYGTLLYPESIGSTEHLDTRITPGKGRTISSTVAGNTALGYPEGAVHGILTVERITDGEPPYLIQTWLDTWNTWIARRRLYNGAWSEWARDSDEGGGPSPELEGRVTHLEGYLEPPPLGSTEDLNTVTEPGRKKASSGSITGNPDLHYPAGAAHGFLDVVRMASAYTSQVWTEVYGDWVAMRRLYNGEWSEWVRLGSGGGTPAPAPGSGVQSTRTNAVTSDYRPDAFAAPDGTVSYWTGPAGVERIPWTYRGEGYVGRIGSAAGYSTMQVKKVESSNEVEVSCLNPALGRHVTHRVQGPTSSTDDQRRFEEGWVGTYSGTTVSKDLLILPRSNIEWAFQINVGGNRQFAPYHGSNSAKAWQYEDPIITDATGAPLDLDSMAVGGVLTDVPGFKVRQRLYLTHPDSGATRWAAVDEVRTIAPDGMIQSESVITFLEDTTIGSNYAAMTPVAAGTFDQLHILDGATYPVLTTPPASTQYVDIAEGHAATSALFTSTSAPNAFVATAVLDADASYRRGEPMENTSATSMRLEERSNGLVKLYPSPWINGSAIPAGTVWRIGAQWRYGETENPGQYA